MTAGRERTMRDANIGDDAGKNVEPPSPNPGGGGVDGLDPPPPREKFLRTPLAANDFDR